MAKLRYLHIIIPQGTPENPKNEEKFQGLLLNLRNTVVGKRFSFEYYGSAQYAYFFIVVEEFLKETIESLEIVQCKHEPTSRVLHLLFASNRFRLWGHFR